MTGLIYHAGRGILRQKARAQSSQGLASSTNTTQSTPPAALASAVDITDVNAILAKANLRSDRSVKRPLTKFTLFKYLAPELRLKIWKYCALQVHEFYIETTWVYDNTGNLMYYCELPAARHEAQYWVKGHQIPLLAACRDSRETYKKISATIPLMKTIDGAKVQRGCFRIRRTDKLSIESIRPGKDPIQTLRHQALTLPTPVILLGNRLADVDGFRHLLKTFEFLKCVKVSPPPDTYPRLLTIAGDNCLKKCSAKALTSLIKEDQKYGTGPDLTMEFL